MAEIKDYSTTAANNNSASPNGMPEGMAPSGVNDAWREQTARIKRWYEDVSAVNSLAGGTTAYTLAASRTISAYAAGDVFLAVCNATNIGASTLNVDSVGAKSIVDTAQNALVAGQLVADGIYWFAYDASNDVFICLNPSVATIYSSGVVATTSGTSVGYTTIPSWARRIIMTINGVTTSGTVQKTLRIGPTGGVATTGYLGSYWNIGTAAGGSNSNKFYLEDVAAGAAYGKIELTLADSATNTWNMHGSLHGHTTGNLHRVFSGQVALSGALTQLALSTNTESDTFTAGSYTLLFE